MLVCLLVEIGKTVRFIIGFSKVVKRLNWILWMHEILRMSSRSLSAVILVVAMVTAPKAILPDFIHG